MPRTQDRKAKTEHPASAPATPAEQDYLREIYLLHEDAGRATIQMLAERLGVKPPSVTAMIKRLAEDEGGSLVIHEPYQGVELTERGLAVALEMLRHHRLIELFLSELLGVPWDQVHEEADRLEHVLSEDLEGRIAAKLGQPAYDPHGDPIPSVEGIVPTRPLRRLDELTAREGGWVAQVTAQDPPLLQYLAGLSIVPGACLTVESVAPFGGVITVRVLIGENSNAEAKTAASRRGWSEAHALGESLARHILLSPQQGERPIDRAGSP